MVIRVEQGKGKKDRYVILSPNLLEILRGMVARRAQEGMDVSRSALVVDHHREPSNPAARRGGGLSHRSGSTVHNHHTPVAIPHQRFPPTPLSHRHRPRFADGDRQRRLRPAKPAASNTRSPGRSRPGQPKPAPRWSLNRRPVRNRQIRSSSGGKFPIDRHQRLCELPRGFLPRGFSDACLRVPLSPVTGRHPKTLNESSRSFARWRPGLSSAVPDSVFAN